jgi:tight adherence protein B
MTALFLGVVAALGTFWLYTAVVVGWTGFGFGPDIAPESATHRFDLETWMRQAGLGDVDRREFVAVVVMLFVLGFLVSYAAFGGIVPAGSVGAFAASFPIGSYRRRRHDRRQRAQEAWPRMIEEIRVQTASLGRSIPHAVFEVGRRGPDELRPAFDAAHREWLLTTDLRTTFGVLKKRLADPTADVACETLLVAHELGGSDLDDRLAALAEDRRHDVQGRKDARSRQAGARFARVFVLLVPAGMALAGMSIGNGRASYRTGSGQFVVMTALALVMVCWWWAGRVMRLPEPQRVFKD